MSPEEIRGWVAIALGAVATISVAIIGARAAWRNSRKSSTEAVELKTWPTYGELVTDNQNQREEVNKLWGVVGELREKIDTLTQHQEASEQRERISFRYMIALRNHISMGFPPPPPEIPPEIYPFFEDFEATIPRAGPS